MDLKIEKVLEQILAVLIQFVKDKKLEHQHQYVRLLIVLSVIKLLLEKKWNLSKSFHSAIIAFSSA